jgi:hypothetical protein
MFLSCQIGQLTITNVWMRKELIAVEIADVPLAHFWAVVIIFLAIDICNAVSSICGAHV